MDIIKNQSRKEENMERTAVVFIKCVKVECGDLTVGEGLYDKVAQITGLPRGSYYVETQKGKHSDPTILASVVNNIINQYTRNGDHMCRVLVIQKKE